MVERESSVDRFGLAGSTLAGRYYVELQVAEGGFAVVYRAHQAHLDRLVALKVLKTPPDLDPVSQASFRERFAAEARTIARLKHPYIVSVHDFGIDLMASGEPAPWMALEWLEGETLEADLDRRRGSGGRTVTETAQLLRPVIDALAYAHRHGIVHRDIKPANMMIVPTESAPALRMMDFGISKMMRGSESTKHTGTSGSPGFSPHYAAPEQVTFSRTGPWTDVHALGLVMTEMLTDEPPFSESDDVHIFEQVMAHARPTPRSRGKQVGRLEKVIEKAVALSPRERWQNAGELLAAIDSAVLADAAKQPTRRRRPAPDLPRVRPVPPLPRTALKREVVDRIVVSIGTAAVLVALAIVGWTLRSGRPGPSISEEFARLPFRQHRMTPSGAMTTPWVVPLPSPPPSSTPAPTPAESRVVEHRRPATEPARLGANGAGVRAVGTSLFSAPGSVETPSTVSGPGGAAHWVDPFDDRQPEKPCRMTVNSIPWSEVWIDGQNTAKHTPLVDYQVGCGHHQIEFKRADLHIDQVEPFAIEPDQPFKRRFFLTTSGQ